VDYKYPYEMYVFPEDTLTKKQEKALRKKCCVWAMLSKVDAHLVSARSPSEIYAALDEYFGEDGYGDTEALRQAYEEMKETLEDSEDQGEEA